MQEETIHPDIMALLTEIEESLKDPLSTREACCEAMDGLLPPSEPSEE